MKRWTLVILFLLPVINNFCQLRLSNKNWYNLQGEVFMLQESNEPINAKLAFQLFNKGKFTLADIRDNRINEGFVFNNIWLAIPVTNTTNNVLQIEAGLLNGSVYKLNTYIFDNGICTDSFLTSKFFPYRQRPIDSRHLYFPITVQPNASLTILFKIDVQGNNFQFPLAIVKPEWRAANEIRMGNFYAAISGSFILLAFLALIWWIWVKERLYFYYFAYVLIYGLMFLSDGEFDFKWLYPNWPAWAVISTGMYGSMCSLFMLLFMDSFLQLKKSRPNLHRATYLICSFTIILLIMIPASCIFSHNLAARKLVYHWGAVSLTVSWLWPIYCIVTRIKDKFGLAKIYAVAYAGVLFSALLFILNSLGAINSKILPPNFWLLGIGLEIITLFIALAINHGRMRNKNQYLENKLNVEKLKSSQQLIETQEAERKRIAMDLHDELGGNLAAIKVNLQSLGLNLGKELPLLRLIDEASDRCRHIAHNLMPPQFEQTPLESLLRNYYIMLSNEGNIIFNFYCVDYAPVFTKTEELFIYRILMELTNNVLKHAEATVCSIELVYYPTKLIILVEDNGKGFVNAANNGMGIKNINLRVEYLNGTMQIDDRTKGVSVIINLPFKKQK